jgi:hypothetical protein
MIIFQRERIQGTSRELFQRELIQGSSFQGTFSGGTLFKGIKENSLQGIF